MRESGTYTLPNAKLSRLRETYKARAKEEEEYQRLVAKKIEEGSFDFTRDKYPPDRRFVKLQQPVTDTTIVGCNAKDRWDQVPFSGSTIMLLPAFPPSAFEECSLISVENISSTWDTLTLINPEKFRGP